jgi:hypothetical protein
VGAGGGGRESKDGGKDRYENSLQEGSNTQLSRVWFGGGEVSSLPTNILTQNNH